MGADVESAKDEEHEQKEPTSCTNIGFGTFLIGLVAGTFSALLCKMAYDTSAVGLDGNSKLFAKPIMMLLLMFSAMAPSMVFWLIGQAFTSPEKRETVSWKTMGVLIIPSLCDLLCTTLLLVAQLYITASLWQMMRGSVIIITALLKRFALNHRLKRHMWIGVGIITIAMLLVASTSFFGQNTDVVNNGKDPRIGVLLVFIGCLAQGVQYVFEEKVMTVDNAPPLVVIGCEGLWGTVLTILVVYPVAYMLPGDDNGSFEDPWDAIYMITHSPQLKYLTIAFVLTVTVYNVMVVYVTKYLSAIWHAILDNFRPISIWGVDLLIFYVILPGTGYGEMWASTSYLQLIGLMVLLFGTAFYNGSVKTFDDVTYEPIGGEDVKSAGMQTPVSMASPSLTRSPLIYRPATDAEVDTLVKKARANSFREVSLTELKTNANTNKNKGIAYQ